MTDSLTAVERLWEGNDDGSSDAENSNEVHHPDHYDSDSDTDAGDGDAIEAVESDEDSSMAKSALAGLHKVPLPAIFTYLHDTEVVAVAKASKALQREALASCGCTAGQVYVTAEGLSGLWRFYELWEVAVLLKEFPRSYCLPFKFLSEYILHDKRSARSLFTAVHEALRRAN